MKTEPQILRHGLDQVALGVTSIKILVAFAIVIALLSLFAAIVEARRRRAASAAGWHAGAAIVAAIVAAVLVGSVTAAPRAGLFLFTGIQSGTRARQRISR